MVSCHKYVLPALAALSMDGAFCFAPVRLRTPLTPAAPSQGNRVPDVGPLRWNLTQSSMAAGIRHELLQRKMSFVSSL
eukprot:1693301-Pleurochrysis_carterae.AAC.2